MSAQLEVAAASEEQAVDVVILVAHPPVQIGQGLLFENVAHSYLSGGGGMICAVEFTVNRKCTINVGPTFKMIRNWP